MSARDVAVDVTSFHGIKDCFEAMLTADDVVNAKPDPEILIKTIGQLDGQVNRTLYVGDSNHDLEAAVSLDMPFLLADTGIYVRGKTREHLRAIAKEKGFPIVGFEDVLNIQDIVMNMTEE